MSAREGAAYARGLADYVLAIPAGFLPRRYWRALETTLPIRPMALLSALLAVFVGAAVAYVGFVAYAGEVAGRINEVALQGAPLYPGVFGLYSLAAFAFFTPLGWVATYLVGSGFLRTLCVAVEDPAGDPLLTGLDEAAHRLWRRRRERREAALREALEGPEVPDVLVTGKMAGAPEAELMLIASRRKPGWEKGAFVITTEKWYRIGAPYERRRPAGLRYFYPLSEVRDLEVLRRGVRYELPDLSDALP